MIELGHLTKQRAAALMAIAAAKADAVCPLWAEETLTDMVVAIHNSDWRFARELQCYLEEIIGDPETDDRYPKLNAVFFSLKSYLDALRDKRQREEGEKNKGEEGR